MKFIYWSLVYGLILSIRMFIRYKYIGWDKFREKYSDAEIGFEQILDFVLWIGLYFWIIKAE